MNNRRSSYICVWLTGPCVKFLADPPRIWQERITPPVFALLRRKVPLGVVSCVQLNKVMAPLMYKFSQHALCKHQIEGYILHNHNVMIYPCPFERTFLKALSVHSYLVSAHQLTKLPLEFRTTTELIGHESCYHINVTSGQKFSNPCARATLHSRLPAPSGYTHTIGILRGQDARKRRGG